MLDGSREIALEIALKDRGVAGESFVGGGALRPTVIERRLRAADAARLMPCAEEQGLLPCGLWAPPLVVERL